MDFKDRDYDFMLKAIRQAEIAYSLGQLPIAAILVINNELIEKNNNSQAENKNYFSHAENILIQKKAKEIKSAHKSGKNIELFTTLEPCLQCFGSAVHNRLTRIIYACPDPIAGATNISPPTKWYKKRWPEIVQGPLTKESYELFMKYMEEHPEDWGSTIDDYKEMEKRL
ncbi:nucleoside deaminase [Candidatus Pacearchaeota archaeon]|nr:nucleoside deaminase [Candidatus Pacearchaeota archaeon]